MGRPVVLSNGQLFVGLNKHGLVHDFYYPYVGLDNLTNSRSERHKIGVWVDNKFSWVNDGSWEMSVDFEADALISDITMTSKDMRVQLKFQDFVDPESNALCRHIKVINQHDHQREIRLFMHQVFQISRAGRADTVLYEPSGNYLLDYKGRCMLLIYGETSDGTPFDQYAVGNYSIESKHGTHVDAEDGELSNNPVEHGSVDSVLRMSLDIGGNQAKAVDYWVVAASSQQDAEKLHLELKDKGLAARIRDTRSWWANWFEPAHDKLKKIDENYQKLTKKSLLVVKAHVDVRGSILASGDSSIFNYGKDYYCYCWPRDGAYAIWPLMRMGLYDEARNFFEFCRDILHPNGYLMHKYQPDRAIGSTWHPLIHNNRRELAIQEDETAVVIIMLGEYLKQTSDKDYVELLYNTLVRPAAQFMSKFIDEATDLPHASYDLWEEKFMTSTYTTAVTYAALRIAAQFADIFNYPDDAVDFRAASERIANNVEKLFDQERGAFIKGFLLQPDGSLKADKTLDMSSLYGMMMFGPKSSEEMTAATAKAVEDILLSKSPSEGLPRYENDSYMRNKEKYLGNPWLICCFWLAQYYIETKQPDRAKAIMGWASDKTLPSGIMSEQIDPETAEQVGVSPLVWSHAEYINTALDLT